jgi:hypothetical protein
MQASMTTDVLIQFWREMDLNAQPYVHPKDKGYLTDDLCYVYQNHESYLQSHNFQNSEIGFHTSLLPVPYAGNLKTASIFLLLLNPGLGIQDYHGETSSPSFVEAAKRNIRQENISDEYPFFLFDPKFIWHPGGQYWLKRFSDYILEVSIQKEKSYLEAISYISSKIAVVELVPYHSKSFGHHKLIRNLKSVDQMKQFAEYLFQRAKQGEIGIVCTRKSEEWGLKESNNVVIYGKDHARGASVSFTSPACGLICQFLDIKEQPQSKMVKGKVKKKVDGID